MYNLIKDGMTQSLMSCYAACPEKFRLATEGWSGKTKLSMQLGSLGHACIEYAHAGLSWENRLLEFQFDDWIDAGDREWARAVIRALISGYLKYHKKQWKSIEPEKLFDVRMPDGFRLRGKRDGVYRTAKGQYGIHEIKFKSRIGDDGIEESLGMDFQSLYYLYATYLEIGKYPTEVTYDVIRYPSKKKSDTPESVYKTLTEAIKKDSSYYFYRWVTEFTPSDVIAFQEELIAKLRDVNDRKTWYKNQFACNYPFRCNYLTLCLKGSDPELQQKPLFSELTEEG